MKVVVLGSSSAGNSTFVEINNVNFLIDVGLGYNEIINKLDKINIKIDNLDFIIITHAHGDHVKSLYGFNRRGIKTYMGIDTLNEISFKDKLKDVEFIDELDVINGISLTKIPISHDKKGFGFVFEYKDDSLVYIADTGFIYSKYFDKLYNKKMYLMESNHDVEMEMSGTKTQEVKTRNIGDEGHISNDDCANKYLSRFIGDKTKYIILIHISTHDNTYDLAYNTTKKIINKNIKLIVAHEKDETELITC